MATKSTIARAYADAGLSPIRIAKGEKRPIGKGWQATPVDAAGVDRWIDQGGNVGLRMGTQPNGSRVVALDEDETGAIERAETTLGPLPETLTTRTGSGGQHRLFAWPASHPMPKTRARTLAGIDVRAEGGQIVAPPSVHPNGTKYEWTCLEGLAELPEAWCAALVAPGVSEARAGDLTGPSITTDRVALVAAVLYPHFAGGSRHELCRAVGGWLARIELGPWSDGEIRAVIEKLKILDPIDQEPNRVDMALEAAARARTGEPTPGWDALRARLGDDDARRLESAAKSAWWTRWIARREARRTAVHRVATSAANDTAALVTSTPWARPVGGEDTEARAGCDPAVDFVITHLAAPAVGLFQRSGKLVEVTRDARFDGDVVRPAGTATIREVVPARLKEVIRTTAGPREAPLAAEVAARGQWAHIRPLDAIVSYPVMRRDGTLLKESGYDAATRTLAEIAIEVDVPDAPTHADAHASLVKLSDLVADFPFAGDAQRSAWISMLLTVPARPAIDGPTPLGLLEATQRGSGKSLLADVHSLIVTGAEAPRRVAPKTREEWDKVLFSILLAGDPLVLFDNVTNMLVSDALDAVLTGTTYAQRLLGVSEDRSVAIRTVFLASANNARLSTDLVRRSLGCRLEPDVEHPETRTGFRHADLAGHVRAERARYLGAALTILRAYAVAGRPAVKARPMGSYTAWCRVVRDAVVWAGGADPATTQDALRETADVERDELRDLLVAWHAVLSDTPVTVRELIDAARTGQAPGAPGERRVGTFPAAPGAGAAALLDALRGVVPGGAEPNTNAVGHRLRMVRGQIVGGLVVQQGRDARGGAARWKVARVG